MGVATLKGRVVSVTPVLDTAAFTSGDVMAPAVKVANAVDCSGGVALLQSLVVVDAAKVKGAFDILLFSVAPATLAAPNAAVDFSDVEALNLLGSISVAGADFKDTASNSYAAYVNVGMQVQAGAGTQDVYAVLVARGATTYGASGLSLQFAFRQS